MSEIGLSLDDDPSPTQPGGFRLADVLLFPVTNTTTEATGPPSDVDSDPLSLSRAEALLRARMNASNRSARFLAQSVLSVKIREK